jgi:hypothetical protein
VLLLCRCSCQRYCIIHNRTYTMKIKETMTTHLRLYLGRYFSFISLHITCPWKRQKKESIWKMFEILVSNKILQHLFKNTPLEATHRNAARRRKRTILVNCLHSYKKCIVYFNYKFVWDDSEETGFVCMAGGEKGTVLQQTSLCLCFSCVGNIRSRGWEEYVASVGRRKMHKMI